MSDLQRTDEQGNESMNCPVDPDSKNLVDMLAKRKTKDSSFSLYGNTTLKRTF